VNSEEQRAVSEEQQRNTLPAPPGGARTIEERLTAIEANTSILIVIMQDIAQELGIRERVRANMRKLEEANGPAPSPAEGE
jgi:hypothetical protein